MSLAAKTVTFDGVGIGNYNTIAVGGDLYNNASTASRFIIARPDDSGVQRLLTLKQVRISGFSDVAITTSSIGHDYLGYDISIESGTIQDGGGGISITDGKLTIDHYTARFTRHAPSFFGHTKGTSGMGGGIYANDAYVKINNAFFGINPVSGVRSYSDSYGNKVGGYGGGIYITNPWDINTVSGAGDKTYHLITYTEFASNDATAGGGAIYTESNLNVYGSKFGWGNSAAPSTYYGNKAFFGGGIDFVSSVLSWERTLNIGAVMEVVNNQQRLDKTDFSYNLARGSGGAVAVSGVGRGYTSLNVNDTTFNYNESTGTGIYNLLGRHGGGAIYAEAATVNIGRNIVKPVTVSLANGEVSPTQYDAGGVEFANNFALQVGGAIKIAGSKVGISSSIVAELIVGLEDGSNENVFASNKAGDVTRANGEDGRGGAIYSYNANVKINPNTIFTTDHWSDSRPNGNSARWGGAIAMHGEQSDTELNAILLDINGATFVFNRATNQPLDTANGGWLGNGGAIWIEGARLDLKNSTFGSMQDGPTDSRVYEYGNHAYEHGGAIYLDRINVADAPTANSIPHSIIDTNFYRNFAQSVAGDPATAVPGGEGVSTGGGAIYITRTGADIKGQTAAIRFEENRATNREDNPLAVYDWTHGGGAIALSDQAGPGAPTEIKEETYFKTYLKVDNVEFVNNTAGSGIDDQGQSTMAERGGGNGGAILANNASSVIVSNSSFEGNRAWGYRNTAPGRDEGGYGGAINIQRLLQGNTLDFFPVGTQHTITETTFTDNRAQNYGGAVSALTLQLAPGGPATNNGEQVVEITVGNNTQTGVRFLGNLSLIGGAVYGRSSVLHIQNTLFEENKAEEMLAGGARAGRGGAIAVEGDDVDLLDGGTRFISGILNLDHSVLVANTATEEGGAIYSNLAIVNVADSVFGDENNIGLNNYTDRNKAIQGGAIALHKSNSTAADANADLHMILRTDFYGNIARDIEPQDADLVSNKIARGGAILVYQTNARVSGTDAAPVQFVANRAERNSANINGTDYRNGGGAIAVANDEAEPAFQAGLIVEYADFKENSAMGNGGAIHAVNATTLDISRSSFEGNYVNLYNNRQAGGGDGGAIALYRNMAGGADPLKVISSEFTSNLSQHYGGAIASRGLNGRTVVLDIGAERLLLPDPKLEKSAFTDNLAWEKGGAIYAENTDLFVSNTVFDGNRALYNPDANGNSTMAVPGELGGAIAVSGGRLELTDKQTESFQTSFTDNVAGYRGGAIWVGDQGVASITNAVFGGYTPLLDDEGQPVLDDNGQPIMVVDTTKANRAIDGGAIFFDGPSATPHTIEMSQFAGNVASGKSSVHDVFGGAVAVVNGADLRISGSDFLENTVVLQENIRNNEVFGGGAIAVIDSALTVGDGNNGLKRSTFTKNVVDGNGGAIYAKSAQLTVGGDFDSNEAKRENSGNGGGHGGAIYIVDSALLDTTRSTFTGNAATDGGAVYAESVDRIVTGNNVAGSIFTGNAAGGSGGAMQIVDSTTIVGNNSLFQDNDALGDGGAVNIVLSRNAANNMTATFTDTDFLNNTAVGNGGGIAVTNDSARNATLTVVAQNKNVKFDGNTADGSGNDIYLKGAASTFTAAANLGITLNGGLDTDSVVTKNGAGALQINADSTITDASANALNIAAGTLGIGNDAVLQVNGTTTLAAGSTLTVALSERYAVGSGDRAALETDSFELGAGATMPVITLSSFSQNEPPPINNCGSYPGTGGAIYTLVSANHDIDKAAYNFVIPGGGGQQVPLSNKQFLWYEEVDLDPKKVQFGAGLIWNNTAPNSAHGTFFIDQGIAFGLNGNLGDNTAVVGGVPGFEGWDGKTLTKTGKGTLVLTGANTYTGNGTVGTIVKEGTLVAASRDANTLVIDSVGQNDVRVDHRDATFQVGAYIVDGCPALSGNSLTGELKNKVTGIGNFAVNSGDGVITVNRVNDYEGMTIVKSGTLLLKNILGTGANDASKIVQIDAGGKYALDLGKAAGANTDLNKKLQGDGSLVKKGADQVTVTGNHRGNGDDFYHGTTIIEGGRLAAQTVDSLGDGTVEFVRNTTAASTLVLNGAGEFDNTITGNGNVEIVSGGLTTLSNAQSDYTGKTDVRNNSSLEITHVNATGRNVSASDAGGPVNLNTGSTLYLNVAETDATYYKQITGAGNVVKQNTGTLVLGNGSSNYAGGTEIEAGRLVVSHVGAVGAGNVSIRPNAEFEIAAEGTFTNLIEGDGDVYIDPGAGKKTTIRGENTYTGKTFVESGTASITNVQGTGVNGDQEVEIADRATLELAEGVTGNYNKKLNGNGSLDVNIGRNQSVTLTAANQHAATNLKRGRTNITQNTALGRGTTTMEGGTILGLTADLNDQTVANDIRLNGNATIDALAQNVALSGDITGNYRLMKTGSGALKLESLDNTFTGGLEINDGRVIVNDQRALGDGPIINNAQLELNLTGNHTLRADDISSTGGEFIKSGTGRLDVDSIFKTKSFTMTGGTIAVNLGKSYIESPGGFNISGNSTLVGKLENSEGINRGEERSTRFEALIGPNADSFAKEKNNALLETSLDHVNWKTVWDGSLNTLFYEIWASAYGESYKDKLSYNALQAAEAIDKLPENDPINQALKKLTDSDDIVQAFSELHGEIYKSAIYAEADLQRNFNEMIFRRGLPCDHCYQFKGFRGQNPPGGTRELWASFVGGGNFRTSFDRFSGYNIGRWGVVAGLEQLFARGFFVGAAIGYDQANMKLSDLSSKDNFYAFRVSTYLNYTYDKTSVVAFIGYAKNWHDVKRNIHFMGTEARGKFNDDIVTAGFELRQLFHWNSLDIIPSIGLNYVHVDSPYLTETDAGPASLYVHRNKYGSARVPMGFRANTKFDIQGVEFKPELRMFYVPEMGDNRVVGTTAFATDPTKSFLVDSGVRARNGFRFGVGVQAKVFDRMSLGVDYDLDIWSKYSRHDVGGNVTVRW